MAWIGASGDHVEGRFPTPLVYLGSLLLPLRDLARAAYGSAFAGLVLGLSRILQISSIGGNFCGVPHSSPPCSTPSIEWATKTASP